MAMLCVRERERALDAWVLLLLFTRVLFPFLLLHRSSFLFCSHTFSLSPCCCVCCCCSNSTPSFRCCTTVMSFCEHLMQLGDGTGNSDEHGTPAPPNGQHPLAPPNGQHTLELPAETRESPLETMAPPPEAPEAVDRDLMRTPVVADSSELPAADTPEDDDDQGKRYSLHAPFERHRCETQTKQNRGNNQLRVRQTDKRGRKNRQTEFNTIFFQCNFFEKLQQQKTV